ncbi:MAG: AAA family ATPase, partial [Deltaproteobacteria bacterium]|nr:AAA family ATPase [Deltaproteobacteria bacterium]
DFHRPVPNLIEALGWGRHLYQPLIYIPRSGKQSMSLTSKPVALNEGEWLLVTHLKALVGRASYLDGVEVWLLRNPPRNGLGFRDIRGAFPDFILWLVRGDEQWFSFIDPHGIRMVTDPASEPKLHLWKTLRDIEGRHPDLGVHLDAWVLSVTPEHEVAPSLRPFLDHHIVYQDNEGRYLEVVMKRLLGVEDAQEGVEAVTTNPQATLRSIELSQWKSFERATLPLAELTVLIGANASGKSNVIEALKLMRWIGSGARFSNYVLATREGELGLRGTLADLVRRDAPERALRLGCELEGPDGELAALRLSLTLEASDGELRVKQEALATVNGEEIELYRATRPAEAVGNVLEVRYQSFGAAGSAVLNAVDQQAVFAQVTSPARFGREHKRAQEVVPRAAIAVGEALCRIQVLDPNPSKMRGYWHESDKELHHDGGNLSAALFALCQDEGMRARVLGFVGELPEKPVDGIEFIRVPRGDVMVQLRETFGGVKRLVDAPLLSDGTLRVLAIAAALLSAPRGSLLAIEEFDNGIHPSQAGRLVRRIEEAAKERGTRVLLTTHNPAMLDALPPATLADVVACHRDPERGDSRLTRLSDLDAYPVIMAQGPLGQTMTQGVLDRLLKARETADERSRKALAWLDALRASEEEP